MEHLKTLLLSGSPEKLLSGSIDGGGSLEPDLATALVQSVEEERDELRLRQAELSHTLKQLEAENAELQTTVGTLREALLAAEGQSQSAEEEVEVCLLLSFLFYEPFYRLTSINCFVCLKFLPPVVSAEDLWGLVEWIYW